MTEQDLPDQLTRRFLLEHREYEIGSPFHQWRALPWKQLVLMEVAGAWDVADCPYYLKELWDILDERRRSYETVYVLIDAGNMALHRPEFQQLLVETWSHLLSRGDIFICPIEADPAKQAIWGSISRIVGTRNTLRVFADDESAFAWASARVREELHPATGQDKGMERRINLPDKPTLAWLEDHAEQHLIGANNKWEITAWNNLVYLKIRESWVPEEGDVYVEHLSGIPRMIGEDWDRIFFIFDMSDMVFKPEDLHLYMRRKWLEVLDHEEMSVCLVEAKKMRRLLLHSIYTLLGKRNRVKILATPDEALEWVRAELVGAAQGGE